MPTSTWYVVQTNPTLEEKAAASLRSAGFGVYLPQRRIEFFHRRKAVFIERTLPLLRGYLFVDIPDNPAREYWPQRPSWFALRRCDGVKRVLGDYGPDGEIIPMPIPPRQVEALMAAQLSLAFDDTREAKVRRQEIGATAKATAELLFPPGTDVIAIDGPLDGHRALVSAIHPDGAIEALIAGLGRMIPVTFPMEQIRKLDVRTRRTLPIAA